MTIATEASDYTEPPVSVDLTGDGVDELVAVIDCDAGGVSWPQVLAVYQTGPELLGYVDLGDVSHAEHSTIKRLAAGANGVTLDWASTDGCCSHERLSTGRVLWDGASVAIRDVTTLTVPDRQCPLADIEDAWAGKKQHCLEPEVLSHLFYPGVPFSTAWADGYLEQVVFLQLRLRDLGYPVAVDGKFGSQTESVVRRYQADKHFVEDGIVGAQTWKGLFGLGRA